MLVCLHKWMPLFLQGWMAVCLHQWTPLVQQGWKSVCNKQANAFVSPATQVQTSRTAPVFARKKLGSVGVYDSV